VKPGQTIKLHYKHSGSGPVVIILHGLFGSLDNWQTMSRLLSEHYSVYCLDLRNHGKSPHTDDFSIGLMAADVVNFIKDHGFLSVHLIGHSMGGKVALEMLNFKSNIIDKVMILDIAPKSYPKGHEQIFKAMFSLDLQSLSSRNSADEQLKLSIPDFTVRQFILKNLDRDKEGKFVWKVNLNAVYKNYDEINKEIIFKHRVLNEVLFVKGSLSFYILKDDEQIIKQVLPNAKFYEIEGAGHWIHADKPEELKRLIIQFFETN
jgi:pimeloyl-ACP methyl ester carboxylesterase